ncbi:MAG: hypothetical protein SNJ75_10270 [Gemmataceae bacterium]
MLRKPSKQKRDGVILLVVLAMLTIFALIGLSFVLYADSAATRARIFREAGTFNRFGDVRETALTSATAAWEEFLGQILYDVNDDIVGVASVLRGHSLGRTLYGWNDAPGALNDRPYTGTGRIENPTYINYLHFQGQPIRDPARSGTRTDPNNLAARGPITGDLNVPYTYPDLNNVFLAMIDPSTDQVIKPSYVRPEAITASGQRGALHYLPSTMPGVPAVVGNGHVKNLENLAGGNDSVWLDYGGGIHIAPDGRKYKCMVAPLIIDLDGRLNVNAAGNVLATGDLSASNMGWGAWEMNPAHLSGPSAPPALRGEWRALTLGNGTIQGRYGPGGLPLGQAFPGGTILRRYAPVDLNGIVDPLSPGHRNPTPRYTFPGQGTTPSFVVFPGYDATAYGNAVPVETTTTGTAAGQSNHPSSYNPITPINLSPTSYNRVFSANDLAGILRRYNADGESVPSDVVNLLPNNLRGSGLSDPAARYRRGLLTTHSFDLDRPGGAPAIWDPTAAPYTATATGFPQGAPLSFPGLGLRNGPVPAHSEFDPATWRSTLPPLRLNLARQLAAYPPVANGRFDLSNTTVAQAVQQAQSDRQNLARELFERLRIVVGARPVAEASPNPDEFRALRWIAQLAVNLVDYIDNDEYSTIFQWAPGEFVYGTELPRLVINEYYAQFDNLRADLDNQMPQRQKFYYRLNVWVELHNPMPSETPPSAAPEGGTVRLHNGTWAAYRLRLCRRPNANIRAPENTRGAPDPANVENNNPDEQFVVDNWGGAAGNDATRTVAPNYGAYAGAANSNQGFYVVGPEPDYGVPPLADSNPGLAALRTWGETNTLSIRIPVEGDPNATTPTTYDASNAPSLILERLANPYLPPQNDPTQPLYNPYITVDYVAKLRVNEGRITTKTADINPENVAARHSYGKVHPFASFDTNDDTVPVTRATALWQPANPVTPAAGQVLHTFMRHNAREDTGPPDPTLANQTLKLPFDVLHHPDRIPVSPAELLHVSWFKPHELTQQFMIGTFQEVSSDTPGHRFQHRARWTNSESRLLRFLDQVSCGTFGAGVAPNGRLPGRVNVNTLWDRNVFAALVDAAAANHFTPAEVDAIYTNFFNNRTPSAVPASTDRIVLPTSATVFGAATPLLPNPRGVDSTIFRSVGPAGSDETQMRLFEPPASPPWTPGAIVARRQRLERFELLTKMANNVTTRSNVFAVWATVGFFEVVDDTTQPVQLGAEMSWPGVGVIRHRMFAILDRSSMQVWPTNHPTSGVPMCRLSNAVTVAPGQQFTGTPQPVTLIDHTGNPISGTNPLVNPNTNRPWIPQPGAIVTFDPNTPNEETVVLESDGMGGLRATFRRNHAANTVVISRGNPGPWIRYDSTQDTEVVIYRTIIE